jgi:hypothetical protein
LTIQPDPPFDLDADAYRRRIRCRAVAPGEVVTDLVDDFHHFRVTLRHDGKRVDDLAVESIRWPWATCPEAAANLRVLVSAPLSRRFTDMSRYAKPRENCTHQFDCAAHALMHAARSTPVRTFDVEVPRRDARGRTRTRCWVDGRLALSWTFEWSRIVDPPPPFDAAPKSGFMAWADATLDPDAAETAIALKRGATIGMGRGWPFDEVPRAADAEIGSTGVCYTMTPGRSEVAFRVHGMIRDFSAAPEQLLAD